MSSRPDIEIKISERLKTIPAEQMQMLAEEYVRLHYPERFPRFDFRAFSPEGKSRGGWPDAWIEQAGRIDGVEATIAKDKSKVRKHILEDIEKTRQKAPSMAGFVLISGHPDVQFDAEELMKFKREFAQAGVPSERCELIFGMSLVDELAKPKFALLRHGLLNMPISPKKFSLVDHRLAWESQQLPFIPSVEDYANGRVHRPQVADEVSSFLDMTGRVLVKGIGSSGKTVLARLMALDRANRGLPSYYLDLARFDERLLSSGELTRDMDDFGGQGVLFILDNVHLNELVASELASHWEILTTDHRPNLLLLGRELRSGHGSSISALKIPVVPLKARQCEVLGVYQRLVGRINSPSFPLPQPPREVLDEWVATFGGDPYAPDTTTDLIAFSAAVLDQLAALMKGCWTLTEQHAVDAIRMHYLDKLSPEETDNLMRLAALAELEFFLTKEALVNHRAAFKTACHRLGLVFQDKVGGHTRYRLAHAALGKLLLKASYKPVDAAKEQLVAALACPFTGFAMARRLHALGQVNKSKAVLTKMMTRPESLLELGNCQYLVLAIRLIRKLEAGNLSVIANVLAMRTNYRRLVQFALATPLNSLIDFMAYTERTEALQPVFATMTEALTDPSNRKDFIQQALANQLGNLKIFLVYLERTEALQPVFAAMTEALVDPGNRKDLIQQTLACPLGDLKKFLAYAEGTEALKPVFAAMTEALVNPGNRKDLIQQTLACPLGDLKKFLAYAEGTEALKPVFVAMTEVLADPGNRKDLIQQTLACPLGDLKTFLAHAEGTEALKPVFVAMTEALADPGNRKDLIQQTLACPLGALKVFLVYAESTKTLQPVYAAMTEALADPGNRKALIQLALATLVGDLKAFLSFAQRAEAMKSVFAVITDAMNKTENKESLVESAINSSLSDLQAFLVYSDKTPQLKKLCNNFIFSLAEQENRMRLAKRFVIAPINQLVAIMKAEIAAELWQIVLRTIDSTDWQRARLLEAAPDIHSFISFQKYAVAYGKPELVAAPALNMVRRPSSQDWHNTNTGIGLHHLSHVLRCANKASFEETARFLCTIATAGWVDEQIGHRAKTGSLAGALLSIASVLPEHEHRHFLRASLEQRVKCELTACRPGDYSTWADAISLLGAAALLGLRIKAIQLPSLRPMELNAILDLRKLQPGWPGIGPLQIQFWLGLRELARLCNGLCAVPVAESETILKHWRESNTGEIGQALPPFIRQNNSEMIAWLERCQAHGWCLLMPEATRGITK